MSNTDVNFCSLSAGRMKEERVRLGLNQAESGGLCGVSREMWGKYERGDAVPGGEVLFSFAAAGADVQYILTGVRSINLPNDPRNTIQQLYLVKSSTEAIVPLKLDKYRAADLQNILCAVARGNSQAVSAAMADYANSELTVAEKDLLAAYRKAAKQDQASIERMAQLAADAAQDEADPGESVNIEGEKHE